MTKASLPVLLGVALLLGAADVEAARSPTPRERQAIARSLRQVEGSFASIERISVSSVDARYAAARWTVRDFPVSFTTLFHRQTGGGWRFVADGIVGRKAQAACVVVRRAVLIDLVRLRCRAGARRFRPATARERVQLRTAEARSPVMRRYLPALMIGACVTTPRAWAAAWIAVPDTGQLVWFRSRAGGTGWTVVYETIDRKGAPPPRSVARTLAACTGYRASDYGF